MPTTESTHQVGGHLATSGATLGGWEAVLVQAREQLSPQLFAAAIGAYEGSAQRIAPGMERRIVAYSTSP